MVSDVMRGRDVMQRGNVKCDEQSMPRIGPVVVAGSLALGVGVGSSQETRGFVESLDHPAIRYSTSTLRDPVSTLNRQLREGAVTLSFQNDGGYFAAVAGALHVPPESQVVVFSQTSQQADRITPANPRAIVFNDQTAIGYVRGGDLLEVAAQDPTEGVVFFTLANRRPADRPQFERRLDCLQCHIAWETFGVPGMLVLSTIPPPDERGYATGGVVDHRTPFSERWGGWYVTGLSPRIRSHANETQFQPSTRASNERSSLLDSLVGRFDLAGYLSAHSDAAALMVLEHQTRMTNLLTYIGWQSRVQSEPGSAAIPQIADELVDYMLFVDEAPLPGAIHSPSGFAARFAAFGPRDRRGRSLRELGPERRLFKYPCSYMIYSPAFDALPATAKDAIYTRLWQVLSAHNDDPRYARLTLADRRAIVEILRDTKSDLPQYFEPIAH